MNQKSVLSGRVLMIRLTHSQAIKVAEQFDRVHLRNTFFKCGEWLRDTGDTQQAMKYFEKAKNVTANVTQLLMDDPAALKVSGGKKKGTSPILSLMIPRKPCRARQTRAC